MQMEILYEFERAVSMMKCLCFNLACLCDRSEVCISRGFPSFQFYSIEDVFEGAYGASGWAIRTKAESEWWVVENVSA